MSDNIEIGKLTLPADTSGIKSMSAELKNLKHTGPEVESAMSDIGKSLSDMLLGFAEVTAVIEMTKAFGEMLLKTSELNEQLGQTSDSLGIPVAKLQAMQATMDLAGVSAGVLDKSLQRLASNTTKALSQPVGQAADAFRQLGISQAELKQGDTAKIFDDVVKGFSKYADSAQKTAAEVSLLGKQGPLIVSVAEMTASSYKNVESAMSDYGATVTDAQVKTDTMFNGTMKLAGQVIKGLDNTITQGLMPGLQALASGFVDSAKKGGTLRHILDILGSVAVFVGKVLIVGIGAPLIELGGLFNSLVAIVTGAKKALSDWKHPLQAIQDFKDGIIASDKALAAADASVIKLTVSTFANADATDKNTASTDKAKAAFKAFQQAQVSVRFTMDQYVSQLKKQKEEEAASIVSLKDYKETLGEVAIATAMTTLKRQGATKAELESTAATMKNIAISKEATTENVAGQNLLIQLQQKILQNGHKQTELDKVQLQIAKDPSMNNNLKNELIQKAQLLDATSKQNAYDKANLAIQNLIGFNIDKQTASLGKSKQEMIVWNQQAALKNALDKDLEKQIITQDQYNKLLIAGNTQIVKENENLNALYTTSQAFTQGFSKGLKDNLNDSENLNKLGLDASNKLITDGTTAFMNMGTQGSQAFKTLLSSMLKFFAEYIIKLEITNALKAAGNAMGGGGGGGGFASMLGFANGGAFSGGNQVTAFADGGVVGGPTTFNMGLMGEAGPEAIMPLHRDGSGTLGVKMNGGVGGGASTGTTHYNPVSIQIHSNQDPKQIADQVKQTFNTAKMISKKTMLDQQRPGGVLSNNYTQNAFRRG